MVLAPPAPYYRLMPKKRPATNLAPAVTPLGRFIREQRDARGWSQDDLADRAGANLTFTNISNIERGKVTLPDPPAMIGIARAFGMHVCDLYVQAGFSEFAREAGVAAWAAETSPAYAALQQTFARLTPLEQVDLEEVARRMIETRLPEPAKKPKPSAKGN